MIGKGWFKKYFEPTAENQHTCIFGVSGSGKTTLLYYLLLRFYEKGFNCIIRDVGKGSELSMLVGRAPLRIFVFDGVEIREEIEMEDVEVVSCSDFDEMLDSCNRDKINVISIPYHVLPANVDRYGVFLNIWKEFFTAVIDRAFEYRIQTPAVLGIDELNTIAPSSRDLPKPLRMLLHELIIAVQELRGNQIRIVGSSQGITELNPNVRKQFAWPIFKKVSESPSKKLEFETLRAIDSTVKRLTERQFMVVNPLREYSYIVEEDLSFLRPRGRLYFTGKINSDVAAYFMDTGTKKFEMLARAVKLLVDKGLRQAEVARRLGCTQGYISQLMSYLKD